MISHSESKEDACEVVPIKFAGPVVFDTHTRAEYLQMRQIQFCPKVTFKGSGFGLTVDQTVEEVDRM